MKIMASDPITSWQIDGETMETVRDFIFLGSKITADGDCSHEIKRQLLLGRKAMTNLDSVLKSRDINLPTKVHLVKTMVFPVVMHGCESWNIKKAEHRRIAASEMKHSSFICTTSGQISRSVASDSLRPHESQHTRPPCPSPSPGVHPDSRPSSQ